MAANRSGGVWRTSLTLALVLLVTATSGVRAAFVDESSLRLPVDGDDSYDFDLADVDGNGTLDVLVANGGQSRLLVNDGSGHFVDGTATRLPNASHVTIAVAFGDVDGVNGPDLILAGVGQNRLLINDGSGGFTDQTPRLPVATDISMDVAFADLDGDGDLDAAIANRGSRNQIWINDGGGNFTDESAARLAVDADPSYAVTIGDVDGDGAPDLFVSNHGRSNRLYLNNRLGVFTDVSASNLPAGEGETGAAVLVDLDGDDDLDLATAEGSAALALLLNDGGGTFVPGGALPVVTAYGVKIAAGDVDFDGTPDLLLGAMGQDVVLLNDGAASFLDATAALLPIDDRRTFGLALSDSDDDLDLDLLLATPQGANRYYDNALTVPRVLGIVSPDYIERTDLVTIDVTAFDEDGVTSLTVVVIEPDASVAPTTEVGGGRYEFVPTQVGGHVVRITAVDGSGESSVREVPFEVLANDETPPTVDTLELSAGTITQGQSVDVQVAASDDRAVASLVLTIGGVNVPLDASGRATHTPTATGALQVEVTATDAAGNVATDSTTLIVNPDAVLPEVSLAATPDPVDITNPITITASATDDVKLVSFAVTVTGPAGEPLDLPVALDASGTGSYTPFVPGTYTFTATAEDAAGNTAVATASVLAEGIPDDEAPQVEVTAMPGSTTPGGIVTLTVQATDNIIVAAVELTVNGQPLVLDENNQAHYAAMALGVYTVVAIATDPTGNVGSDITSFSVVDPSTDSQGPVVEITSPADDAEVTTLTNIVGTASDLTLVSYELAYAPAGTGDFTTFASGTTSVEDGVLGAFDPTMVENGVYELRLVAEDVIGRISSTSVVINVTGDLKLGQFSVSFLDKALNIGRMPLDVTRVYDSRNRDLSGDFGYGWSIDATRAEAVENRLAGLDWREEVASGFFPTYFIVPTRPHTVTIRFSEEDEERFSARPNPDQSQLFPIELLNGMSYEPVDDSKGQLSPNNVPDFFDRQSGEILTFELVPYNPTAFTYRSEDNYVYRFVEIPGTSGLRHELRQITDPTGTTVTFGDSGFTRSDGLGLAFVRDGEGRITRLIDPNGNEIEYSYDSNGDLVAVTDGVGSTTTFIYDSNHYLMEIRDPSGTPLQRQEYDDEGRLIAITDAAGNRVEMEYDVDARTQIIRDRRGNPTIYEYDEKGNVTRETSLPEVNGVVTPVEVSRTFDADGQLLSETNGLGVVSEYTYNNRGERLTAVLDVGGLELTESFTYDTAGRVLTHTDPRGHAVTNVYAPDGSGNLLSTTDRFGATTTYEYEAGRRSRVTDPLGNYTLFEYDALGNNVRQERYDSDDVLQRVMTFTYDANGNKLTESTVVTIDGVPTPLTTTYAYDANDRVISVTDPRGNTHVTEYDGFGRKSADIDATPAANRTEYTYSDIDEITQIEYADGTSTVYGYDADGNRTSETNRDGHTTSFEYDALDRLTRVVFPDGNERRSLYDAAGNLVAEIDELGNRTDHDYDAAGRRVRTLQPEVFDEASGTLLRPETRYEYDANGNRTALVDANGNRTEFTYDEEDRLTSTLFPDGRSTSVTLDPLGREVARTDAAGNTTLYAYDALDRLVSTSLPAPAPGESRPVTSYVYDEAGRLVEQIDANGHATTFEYDAAGNRTARIMPEGQREEMVYDAENRLATHTDFAGRQTSYTYDSVGRTTSVTYGDGSAETTTYTGEGNAATVTDDRGTTTLVYDTRTRLTSSSGPDGTFTYTYTPTGKQASVTVNGRTTSYGYDAIDRLVTVEDPDALVTAYGYDAVGNLARVVHDNGATVEYQYNSRNQLTSVVNRQSGGGVLSSHVYTLDANGLRTQVVEDGATTTYVYDDVQRLVSETRTGADAYSVQYTYDAVGNRQSADRDGSVTSYSYDDNNRLLTEGSTTYGYDASGNRITRTEGLDVTRYDYDARNRLIRLGTPSGLVEQYVYDRHGNRVQVQDAGGTVIRRLVADPFHVSGHAQVLEERDGAGTLIASYSHGLMINSQTRGGSVSFYHPDGTGSTRALTDATETVTDSYLYDAFGVELAATGTTANDYRFAGQQYDVNSGFYYLRARFYDPRTGVFTSMDPEAGDPQSPMSLHRYLYANDNPVNFSDPSGRFSLISVSISISINSSIRSIYTQNLVKFFLKAAKICYCSLKPAYEMQAMGLDMIARGLPGGFRLYEQSRQNIAAAFRAIGKEIAATYEAIYDEMISVKLEVGSDLDELYDKLVEDTSYPNSSDIEKLLNFKETLDTWLGRYSDAMLLVDSAAAGDACGIFTALDNQADFLTGLIPSF